MGWNFFNNNSWQILINILGGLITVALIELGKFILLKYHKAKFKGIFGNANYLVYGELEIKKEINDPFPFQKTGNGRYNFSASKLISSCEGRAANYLSSCIGSELKKSTNLVPDSVLKERLNISYISFGGKNNLKTVDVLNNKMNKYVDINIDNVSFISKRSSRQIVLPTDKNVDYGLILKIHPNQFPRQTWIACAGFGEWGTSGAAWYLAKKWNEIYNFSKDNPFCFIVKVNIGQDESAEPVIQALTSNDLSQLE